MDFKEQVNFIRDEIIKYYLRQDVVSADDMDKVHFIGGKTISELFYINVILEYCNFLKSKYSDMDLNNKYAKYVIEQDMANLLTYFVLAIRKYKVGFCLEPNVYDPDRIKLKLFNSILFRDYHLYQAFFSNDIVSKNIFNLSVLDDYKLDEFIWFCINRYSQLKQESYNNRVIIYKINIELTKKFGRR